MCHHEHFCNNWHQDRYKNTQDWNNTSRRVCKPFAVYYRAVLIYLHPKSILDLLLGSAVLLPPSSIECQLTALIEEQTTLVLMSNMHEGRA